MTVTPSAVNHQLTETECCSMGWIFHVTDKKFERSIFASGLLRRGRDALHFMYENDGSLGYVKKGAGTQKPRTYETTIYCVLNVAKLIRDGYDLFLTGNGVVLIFDDVSLEYFRIVHEYPYLGLNVFSRSVPHSLPREVQGGHWRDSMTLKKKYEEYLSPDEISKYIDSDDGQLVEGIPRSCKNKRRQPAREFMGLLGFSNLIANSSHSAGVLLTNLSISWLILIPVSQHQLNQLLRTFAWTSTTMSSSHQSFAFGLLIRSWPPQEKFLLLGNLQSFATMS